ncbi:hypothetical protein LCGC14_2973970, partial [marine sediment metagenome]
SNSSTVRQHLPFIFLTSNTDTQQAIVLIKEGADDFVNKPFEVGELVFRIRRTIKEKQNQRAIDLFNTRLAKDLEAAARLQRTLLPKPLTEVHDVNFGWIFNPCDEIGGDLFNIFKLDNEHLGIFFIDVSGHGVSSALFSFALSKILSPLPDQSSLFREYAENPDSASILPPGEVAKHLNNRFPLDTETEQYFTLLYGILDRKSQEFHYVSAGHPGIVYHAYNSSPRIISVASPPIGFIPGFEYQEKIIPLSSGDRLYIYSDGIVEAGNNKNQLFGEKGLTKALAESRNSPLKDTLQFLINGLNQWLGQTKAEDDISILGIEIV